MAKKLKTTTLEHQLSYYKGQVQGFKIGLKNQQALIDLLRSADVKENKRLKQVLKERDAAIFKKNKKIGDLRQQIHAKPKFITSQWNKLVSTWPRLLKALKWEQRPMLVKHPTKGSSWFGADEKSPKTENKDY